MKIPKYLKDEDYPKFTKFSDKELQGSNKIMQESLPAWEETLKLMISNFTKFLKKIGYHEGDEFKL